MKHPFRTFMLLVVVPAAVALLATVEVARSAWSELHAASHGRVAGMTLAALDQELGAAAGQAVEAAVPVDDADPDDPAVRRALAGDTVRGYRADGDGLEVVAVLGGQDGGPVRMGTAPIDPRLASRIGGATGYRTAVYVRGARFSGTTPPVGPDRIPDAVTWAENGGARLDGGVLRSGPGSPPVLAVLAVPTNPPPPAVPRPVILVLGLLLLFSTLAAWIQLARPTGTAVTAPAGLSFGMLALIPMLAMVGLASHVDRTHEERVEGVVARDLSRALSAASAQAVAASPSAVRALTGFDATRVRRGTVEASTLAGADAARLAALPAPPPSFTSTGVVDTPAGPLAWAGLRLRDGAFVVATTPLQGAGTPAPGRTLWMITVGLALWLAGATAMVVHRSRRYRADGI